MSLPNRLTVLRILLVAPFLFCVLQRDAWIAQYAALVLFLAAVFTDYLDGVLARRLDLVSRLGQVLDPLADKLLLTASLVAFAEIGIAPAWMVVVILSREFLVTGLRVLAAAEGDVMPASRGGKNKTLLQNTYILTALAMLSARATIIHYANSDSWESLQVRAPHRMHLYLSFLDNFSLLAYALLFVATILSVWSGGDYVWKNRRLLVERRPPERP